MMRRMNSWTTLLGSLLALLLVAGVPAMQAQDTEPAMKASLAAITSNSISYQGVLTENGKVVTGTRDMTFKLFSDMTCTSQIGSDIVNTGVSIQDGLFTTTLDVDHSVFNGQALWIQTVVSGQTIGCTEILPAPYALNLVPGAEIDTDSVSSIFRAINQNTAERTRALYGKVYSTVDDTAAVYGHSAGASGETYGVYGKSDTAADGAAGVYGTSTYTDTTAKVYGVYGYVNAPNGRAVQAVNDATSGQGRAIYGKNYSIADGAQAIYGHAGGTSGETVGVYGKTDSPDGYGIYAENTQGGESAYFDGGVIITGTVNITGSLEATGSKNFLIPHPLDPENSYLRHAAVEAPEMLNVYNGSIVLDANGTAVVNLPDYFEALNTNFRYQLTPVGMPAPDLHIASEITNNQFTIAGGPPNLQVSWEVTGVRNDAWARTNPLEVEVSQR